MNTVIANHSESCSNNAIRCAHENFEESRGFSVFDLPLWNCGPADEQVSWETITDNTHFEAATRYLEALAEAWLADGTVTCYCD